MQSINNEDKSSQIQRENSTAVKITGYLMHICGFFGLLLPFIFVGKIIPFEGVYSFWGIYQLVMFWVFLFWILISTYVGVGIGLMTGIFIEYISDRVYQK